MEASARKIFADEMPAAHRRCQYMGGMEIGPVCGEPTVPHYSYCQEHKEVCYHKKIFSIQGGKRDGSC